MDFGGGLDGGVVVACSVDNTNNTASTATANTLFSDAVSDVETKQKWYGSVGFLKHESHFGANNTAEDYLRLSKVAKTTTTTMLRSPFVGSEGHQMLSFSTPYYQHPSFTGYGSGNMHGELCAVKGPFTPSQWMELEHQALIYKYITANIPIPHHLLNPIRKAAFSTFGLSHNSLGWNGFHLGFSNNTDPEPGRCRRTDGKKWRCSRDAVAEQKYCERHMNRGRHRSRKPVEGPSSTSTTTTTTTPKLQPPRSYGISKDGSEQENKSQHPLRQFINDWPKNQSDRPLMSWPEIDFPSDQVKLSREIEATQMRLGVGTVINEENQRETNWIPISWEPSMGGPLGEVFHGTNGRTTRCNNGSPKPESSPTGVLQKGALF